MKSKLLRVKNVCLLSGRHQIAEQQIRFVPEVLTEDRFGVILLWDESHVPYLKLKMKANQQEVGVGKAGYQKLVEELHLPDSRQTPPPGIGWSCVMQRGDPITVSGYIDTNDMALYETARKITNEFTDHERLLAFSITAILVAGNATEQFELEIILTPPDPEQGKSADPRKKYTGYRPQPYGGYIGLDIGNHNSTIAAYSFGAAEDVKILKEPGSGTENASLQPDARPISSAVCYRSVTDATYDDSSDSINYLIGRLADNRAKVSMDGVELAAKRLAASPYFHTPKEYSILSLSSRSAAEASDQVDVSLPRRLAGELLAARMLHLFREGTRTVPTRIAISYPTTFSEREVNQLREVVHRGWLRMYPRPQDEQNLKVLKRPFLGPAKLTADSEGILFMLDEASAAAFFFLFDRILKADGQLSRFRYLYPNGLNLLLCDCGGGTTDIALVRALVRANEPRKLVLTVRGRVGHRQFGGDFITECVHRILKSKVAAELSVDLNDKPLPRFPKPENSEAVKAYLNRHADAFDAIIPTKFEGRGPNSVLTSDSGDREKRSFALWRIAEAVKLELAAAEDEEVVRIPSTVWEEVNIPGLTENLREGLDNLTISRKEVDALVQPRLTEVIDVCNSLIQKKLVNKMDTGFEEEFDDPEEVHWVVAAGAACKYPLIPDKLREGLQVPFLNSLDAELRRSRMTIDEPNLKHAVAKGLAKIMMIKDMYDIQPQFDSDLWRRLPFEIVYRDRLGHRRVLFRENAHFDSLTDSQSLVPNVEPSAQSNSEEAEEPGHFVVLYRRFPGESKDTAYLKYYFREGVAGELKVRYDPEYDSRRGSPSPFVMINEATQESGECEDLSPEETYLHPVQRGDL